MAERGNRNQRIDPVSLQLLEAALQTHYATPQAKSAATVYRLYREQCLKQGVPVVSQQTFYRVRADFTTNEVVAKRQGRRAAYASQPFSRLDQTTPRHGERPFALAHLDHTELDIILVSSLTGKPLGKPWATFLTDAYLSVEGRSERKWELILEEWREQHAHLTRVDEQLEWLKSLSNRTHVLFVLAGPCALFGFRNTSGQLARRGRDIHFARCLEMEARAGERKIAMHESESAKQFQALLSKPAMPANGQGAQAQGTRHEARDLKSKGERVKFPWHQIYCG